MWLFTTKLRPADSRPMRTLFKFSCTMTSKSELPLAWTRLAFGSGGSGAAGVAAHASSTMLAAPMRPSRIAVRLFTVILLDVVDSDALVVGVIFYEN